MNARSHADRDAVLENIFTDSQPLGPSSLDEVRSRREALALFDNDNELDIVFRRSSPVFLVGRRGSGKTAFLKSAVLDGELCVDLNSATLIAEVGETIRHLGLLRTGQFTERIVAVWEACFVAALCSRVWSKHCGITREACPEAFEFGRVDRSTSDGRATDVVSRYLARTRASLSSVSGIDSLTTFLDSVSVNQIPLWAAREQLAAAARARGCSAMVSMDSLDQYEDIFYEGGVLASQQALALRGLFRAVSRLGRASDGFYKVRLSFPSELWHFYSNLSANPLKDFDNTILLHWDNHELLHIAAVRLSKRIELAAPDEYKRLPVFNPGGRWANEILLRYLPVTITNGMGRREFTLPYLLRHTQLLPRHFIYIMNTLFAERSFRPGMLEDADIRDAVTVAERLIADTVISSYRIPYPRLQAVCSELIPRLPTSFSERHLHEVANHASLAGMEYRDALQMLVEVGVIGRRVEETEYYHRAEFEYLRVGRMFVTDQDLLCLHPIFAGTFDSRSTRPGNDDLPILPLGSDPSAPREYGRYVHLTR